MSLIAFTPEHVVYDHTFISSGDLLSSHPKGRWFAEQQAWVLICGGLCNETAYEEYLGLVLDYVKTGIDPEHRNEDLFTEPGLIVFADRVFRVFMGSLREIIEPESTDGILQDSWLLCRRAGLEFKDTARVMATVCPTFRRLSMFSRKDGTLVEEYHAYPSV